VFFGAYLTLRGHRRQGAACAVIGVAAFFFITKLLMPHFAIAGSGVPRGSGQYWSYTQLGKNPFDAVKNIVVHPTLLPRVLFEPAIKQRTEFAIFWPFAFLAVFSPLTVLAIPLLGERFLSSTTSYWVQMYHYTATISPVVAMASADGLANVIRWTRSDARRRTRIAVTAAAVVLVLNVVTLPNSPLWSLTHSGFYRQTATVSAGNAALAHIPAGVSVEAQNAVAPHVTHRNVVTLLTPLSGNETYIIASIHSSPAPVFTRRTDLQKYLATKETHGYVVVFHRNGWLVLAERPRG